MKNSAKKSNAVVVSTNVEMLQKLNAIGITETLKEKNAGKSIFKKEFNNKTDRTSCRTKFINAVQMYLLHCAHNKKELADAQLIIASNVATKYYVAENKFLSASDYYSSNMDENKRSAINMFIEMQNVKEIKIVAPKKAKVQKIVAPVLDAVEEIK